MATIIDSNGTPTSESSALSVIDVTLDIRQNRMVSVLLKQYNKQSQQIKFTVTDNGEKIELKEIEHTVLFKMMTPDGRKISSYCTIDESDHTAILTVAKNYCSYPGKGTAELEVMDALEESQVGTMNMNVIIENSVYPDEMINGSSTYQGLDEKINAVREVCNSAIIVKEETESIRDETETIHDECVDLNNQTAQNTQLANDYANMAQSYANGESGAREGEETDNAKYYYNQTSLLKTDTETIKTELLEVQEVVNQKASAAESYATNASNSATEAENSASQTSIDRETVTALANEVNNKIGSPLTASTSSDMINQNKIYVYTGSEDGYTFGNWYYYDGSSWVSGGIYNSTAFETDSELIYAGQAADAKATGDKLSELKDDLSDLVSHKEFTGNGTKFYDLHFEVGKTYRFKSVTNGIAYVLKTVSEKSSSAVIDTITEGMPYGLTCLFQPTSEASILYVYSTGLGTLTIDEVGTTKDEVERLKNSEKVTFLLGSDGINTDVFHFEKGYKYIVKNESETSAVQLWTRTDIYGSNIETISDALLAKSEIEFIPTLSTQYLLIYANGPATVTIKKITNIGFKLYESGQIHFTVPVNQKRLYDTQTSGNTLIDSEADTVNVNCVCMLPKTYSPNGKPSKLLMICHGSGGGVTETDWFRNDTTVIDFFNKFVDDSYVIFDCNGYKNGTEGQEIWGNDRGVLAYRKAYEYMVKHYNVEHDMYIYAFSMGGLTALNYCNRFKNVKALAMGSPVCSLYNTIYVDQSVQAKGDVGRAYGFTQPTVYEVDKIDNCDPYARMITIGDKQYYPCDMPTTKVWHGDSDTAVYYQHSQELANAMRNTGKNVYYRIVEGKGHEICYGGNSVVTNEILMFLRRF